MITYNIPGHPSYEIKHIVFDYNGTLAHRGQLIEGVIPLLHELAEQASLYVVTADTFGTVKTAMQDLPVEVLTFPTDQAGPSKEAIVNKLGASNTISVGNGFNDLAMFQAAALSICVIEQEGSSGKAMIHADIVCTSIIDALNLLLNEQSIKATLRG